MVAALRDVPITSVVRALGGPDPRGGRIRAWWRDGDGLNVAIDPAKGQWYDHARGEGGGVLSLIRNVMLVDDAGALAWLIGNGFLADRPREAKVRRSEEWGPVVASYDYSDANGELIYQVRRHDPKRFSQWRREGGEWVPGVKGCPRLLYRLVEVIAAPIVFVVEGEKDADTLADYGFVATCNSGGAGNWPHELNPVFAGKDVAVIPDADEPGMRHAADVAKGLLAYAARLRILILDGAKDVTEWFAAGHSETELIAHVEGAHVV